MRFCWTISICVILLAVAIIGWIVPDPIVFSEEKYAEQAFITDTNRGKINDGLTSDLEGTDLLGIGFLVEDGIYSREFETMLEKERVMNDLGFSSEDEVLSLLTDSPLIFPRAPLDVDSLAELLRLIVTLSDEYLPLDGRVQRITFTKKRTELILRAEIDIALEYFKKKCLLDFLPERGILTLSIRYSVKNNVLSAYYDDILLRLDGYDIPDSILSLLFCSREEIGNAKCIFADAVGNVIKNACFSG